MGIFKWHGYAASLLSQSDALTTNSTQDHQNVQRQRTSCLLMARTEMPSLSKRQATSATRSKMFFMSAIRVPLSPYFILVLSSAKQQSEFGYA